MFDAQAKNIAENVTLLVVARLSMALSLPALGFIVWLGGQWLDQKFEMQDGKITAATATATNYNTITTSRIDSLERTSAARVDTVERTAGVAVDEASKVNNRLVAVETKQTQDSAASERFQTATLQRLDRMQDSIIAMSNAVAALTATLQADRDSRSKGN
jgi:hypothetical protein